MTVKELNTWFKNLDDEKLRFIFPGLFDEIMLSADPKRCTVNHFHREANAAWRQRTGPQKQEIHDKVVGFFDDEHGVRVGTVSSVHTYVLVWRLGFDVKLLATSGNKDLLREMLREEVKNHLEEYFADSDEEGFEIKESMLAELEHDDTRWCDGDEDRTYELEYSIMEVPVLN